MGTAHPFSQIELLTGHISPKNIEALKLVTGFFSDANRYPDRTLA